MHFACPCRALSRLRMHWLLACLVLALLPGQRVFAQAPTAPAGLSATATQTQIALTWTAVTGATSYRVYRGTAAGGESATAVATGLTAATYTDSSLTTGTTYYYKVTAVGSSGESAQSTEASAVTVPPAPTDLIRDGNTQVSISWDPAPGAVTYNIERTTSSTATPPPFATGIASNTYKDNNLTNGTTYYYTVTAVNPAGESARSNKISITPSASLPLAPSANLSATPGNAKVTLSWDAVTGATSYSVYRAAISGAEGNTPLASGLTSPSYVNSGLTNGTTYYYQVTALNTAGESARSYEVSAAPQVTPSNPSGLTATAASSSQITLSWTASTNATRYPVQRSLDGSTGWTTIGTATTTSYTDSGLSAATLYYYRVSAQNVAVYSAGYSNIAHATTAPTAPTGLTATGGSGQVALSWTASAGASSYTLYRGTTSGGEGSTAYRTGLTGSSYTDTGVTNGTAYFYTLKAVNSGGASTSSNEASATPLSPPGIPTGLSATAGNGQVVLTWTAATGAATYNVYRGTSAGGEAATPVQTGVTGTSFTNTGLTNGTAYFYRVTAVNTSGESAKSNEATASPLAPPATPSGLTATPGNAQVSLSWTASTGAASYNLYRATTASGEGATPIQTGVTSPFVNTGLINGTTYYYQVTAVNGGGESGKSSEATAIPTNQPPATPTDVSIESYGDAHAVVVWSPISGASSYNLYRRVGSGSFALLHQGITSTMLSILGIINVAYADTGLTNGTTYTYYATAVNSNGESGPSSQTSTVPITQGAPVAPTYLAANVNGSTGAHITWNQSLSYPETYNLYRSTTPGGEGALPIAAAFSPGQYGPRVEAWDTGLTPGVTYYYKVTSCRNGAGYPDLEGPLSTEASVKAGSTPLATPHITGQPGNCQLVLTWPAIAGASSYNIYRSGYTEYIILQTVPAPASGTPSFTETDLNSVYNGVDSGLVTYSVSAVNSDGEGLSSNVYDTSHTGFGLQPTPGALTVPAGQGRAVTILTPATPTFALADANGYPVAIPVSLSVTGAPAGVTAWLTPPVVTLPFMKIYYSELRSAGATLYVYVAPGVAVGTYPLTITGVAGPSAAYPFTQTLTYTLTVTQAASKILPPVLPGGSHSSHAVTRMASAHDGISLVWSGVESRMAGSLLASYGLETGSFGSGAGSQ